MRGPHIAAEMAAYQELHADGGEEGPHKEELEEIIGEIEKLHAQVRAVLCRSLNFTRRPTCAPAATTAIACCVCYPGLQVESEAAELKAVKDEIADNEQEQLEARSEAAAQRMLLEEDAELRKAIQEEERAKLEKQNEALIEAKLEEERCVWAAAAIIKSVRICCWSCVSVFDRTPAGSASRTTLTVSARRFSPSLLQATAASVSTSSS